MAGSYDIGWVLLSIAIAIIAAYAMLGLAVRLTAAQGRTWISWLTGGSLSMGFGVWSMHFIGMLAFRMPMTMTYNVWITLFSIAPAVAGSAVLLYLLRRSPMATPRALLVGSVMLGGGIGAMHYGGMTAMQVSPAIVYVPSRVVLSVVLAIALSAVGVSLAFRTVRSNDGWSTRVPAAIVFGLAVSAMHYMGMTAAQFSPNSTPAKHAQGLPAIMLIAMIGFAAVAVLVFTVLISILDAKKRNTSTRVAGQLQAAFAMAVVTFVVGSALTLGGVIWRYGDILADARTRFDFNVEQLAQRTQERLDGAVYGLRGARGVYAASNDVGTAEFRAYVASRSLDSEFPGVLGFGFVERVARTNLDAFIRTQRRDGAESFDVITDGAAPELYVVKIIEPIAQNRHDMGLDFGANPVRREALERAIRTGEPALSGRVMLTRGGNPTPGFLYLMPVFANGSRPADATERSRALVGVLYAPLAAREFLASVAETNRSLLDFELFDGTKSNPTATMFSSTHADAFDAADSSSDARQTNRMFTASRALNVGGHSILLRAVTSEPFERNIDRVTPVVLGLGGALLSALLALAAWLLAVGRVRALATARRLTSDLDRLAKVARHTTNVVIITDAERRITWVNEGFTRITGYSLEEAEGQIAGQLLAVDTTDSTSTHRLIAATASGDSFRGEVLNRRKNGAEYWADLEIQPLRDDEGMLTGYMEIESDITAQKDTNARLEAALRETDALLHTVHMHSIVSVTSADGKLTDVNGAFIAVSGYTREELIGQDHQILNSGTHGDLFWSEMWRDIAAGRSWRGEICNRAKDGSLFWVDSMIAPFLAADGSIEKYVTIRMDITASKAVARELVRERQRLTSIIDGTNAGTWEWDATTRQFTINERWAEMIGCTVQDLTPATEEKWHERTHRDDLVMVLRALRAHLAGETSIFECESRIRHRDGHWVWTLARGRVSAWTADGIPMRMSGTHMDITQRKLDEQRLRANETFLQTAGSVAGVGGWQVDIATGSIDWTDETCRIHGVSPGHRPTMEEAIGFYTPDARLIIEQAIGLCMSQGSAFDHELQLITASGQTVWVRAAGVAEFEGGKPVRIIGALQDVTVRRREQDTMRELTSLLRSVLDAALDVTVIATDVDLRTRVFNRGAERMLGFTASEMMGQSVLQLHDPLEVEQYRAELSDAQGRTREAGAVFTDASVLGNPREWVFVRRDGSRFPAALVFTAMHSDGGDLIGYLGVGRDVTRQREYEASLTEAIERAEQASAAKGQFLANMSHEIRTPMNAILGMLRLLQRTELTARQTDYVGKTEGAARSLLGLLNDILDFSKADAGKMTLDLHPFRLDNVLRDLSVILSATAGEKGVEVLFDIDPAIPRSLIGDAQRLQQVLINLGGNAIKFTAQGEVVVRLRMRECKDTAVSIELSVRDSGIGIALEHQQHIFDGFSQAEASTTRRFGGTGLGLAICRRLVALMGGDLVVHSTIGVGSTFSFCVDFALDRADVDTSPAEAGPALGALRTLIVDDNPLARDVLSSMVETLGWKADVASSGAEALAMIAAYDGPGFPYQAVLVDWQMPGMDGWETSLRIRAAAGAERPPLLVMVTAHGREMLSSRTADEQESLSGFLVKPVTASMLFDAVATARASLAHPLALRRRAPDDSKRLQGLRLLVVEDNAINQQVAQELLEAEGATVSLAGDGEAGIAAVVAANPRFDAVLMDVQMPVMDGYTATRALRAIAGFERLPIIAMTANARESDRAASLAAGMNDHVGKPFELTHLVETVLRYTEAHTDVGTSTAVPSVVAGPIAPPDELPELLPPFDIPAALRRLNGKRKLVRKLLVDFGRKYAGASDDLSRMMEAGEGEDAMRLAHTLKGVAGALEAPTLYAAARDVEAALRDERALSPTLKHAFDIALGDALRACATLTSAAGVVQDVPRSQVPVRLPAHEQEQARARFASLRHYLLGNNMAARECFSELREALAGAECEPALDVIGARIAEFEFALAAELATALLEQLAPAATVATIATAATQS